MYCVAPPAWTECCLVEEHGRDSFGECLDFSFNGVLLFFVHCSGVKFDVVLITELGDGDRVLGGACIHSKLVHTVTVSVVEIDDVTQGFDKCFGGLVFGHDPVAVAGADVLEDEPAGETSDRYGGDFSLIVDGDDLAGVLRFNSRSVGFVELVSFSKFTRGARSFTHDVANETWCEFLVDSLPCEVFDTLRHDGAGWVAHALMEPEGFFYQFDGVSAGFGDNF